MLIKWGKNEFQKFLPGTIFKLRSGINGVGEFRYDTILVKISYESGNWFGNCWGGDRNFTQTHTHTHTHIEAHFISLVFLRKGRNQTKKVNIKPYIV